MPRGFPGYLYSLAVVGLSTALAASMFPYFDLANLIMVYLLGVVVVAGRWGRGPSLLAAALSVGAFDFLFVPPYFTLAVSSTRHLLTFAVMGIVALVIGTLTVRIREQAEAAEGHRLRHALLAAVSHDLRTPLASIAGAASSLAATPERLDAGGRRELVLTIHEEAQRMSRLVTDLLEMARLQSRRPTLRREWQPLEEVLGAALHHLDRQIGEREIVLHVPDDLPLVEIDDVLIERVLVNLLDNALRYSASGAAIELAAQASGGAVTVAILDRGPGLAPGEETRIFDEFVRGDAAQSRDGVGLGLALARAIVEAHGGRIWAENRPEGGTAFRFTVPSAP